MTTRWGRFARGQIAAVFSTFVAAFCHGVSGGGHPPLFAVALAFAFSGMACVFLAGVRLSKTRLALSVALSQLLYHGLFSLFGSAAAAAGSATAQHHGLITFSPASPTTVALIPSDHWMLLGHAAAAVVTFAVLLHGERLCVALATLAGIAFSVLVRQSAWSATPTPLKISEPTGHRVVLPYRMSLTVSSLRHRGPPFVTRFA